MPTWTAPYPVDENTFDEALHADGSPRPGYGPLVEGIAASPQESRGEVSARLKELGVEFGATGSSSAFEIDPLPRLFRAEEWCRIESGLIQRVRALSSFLKDAYGDQEIIAGGIIPERILDESIHFEPIMRRCPLPVIAHVSGPDLIRDAEGEILVLEDNLRTPSGLTYVVAGRDAVTANPHLRDMDRCGLEGSYDLLLESIRDADPTGGGDPAIALLSDGPESNAWYEHRELSRQLGIALVTPDDLVTRGGRLFARPDGPLIKIDVLYNRSGYESLRDTEGELNPLGQILAEPIETGDLACVNSFGTGIADDKATYCHVEKMIRFYLGEEPLLRSVPSYDLGEPDRFEAAIDRIGELVIKPRWSFGGHGIVLGPDASPEQLREIEAAVRSAPADFVAQEPVNLSVHPTVAGGGLEPRHIDFRPFVYTRGEHTTVLPGGLTRFAGRVGDLIVNSTQGGGSKDTWVLK